MKRTAILFSVFVALWHFFTGAGAGDMRDPVVRLSLMLLVPLFSIGITPLVQPNDTRFQPILPVTARQVFTTRMASVIALQWLPVLTGATLLLVLRDALVSELPLWAWSMTTCAVLGLECGVIRGLTVPRWVMVAVLPVWLFLAPVSQVVEVRLPLGDGCRVDRLDVAIGSRVFAVHANRDFVSCAEGECRGTAEDRGRSWKPVLRTLFPLWGLEYGFYFLSMCAMHTALLVYLVVISGQNWTSTRATIRWMTALPVRPRALLGVVMLPAMLSIIGGYLVGMHLAFIPNHGGDMGLRTQIVTVAFIAGWLMLANLSALAGDWHVVRRVMPSGYGPAILALGFMGVGLGMIVLEVTRDFDVVSGFHGRCLRTLGP